MQYRSSLCVLVILGHGRRQILHIEVTTKATAIWLAGQMEKAFPPGQAPVYLVRDNDRVYGQVFRRKLGSLGIRDSPTRPHSPWENGYVERVIGSIRRECIGNLIVLNAAHLRRVLNDYVDYYNNDRTHLGIAKDAPNHRPVEARGTLVSKPILGGLHHRYSRIPPK